MIILFAAIVFLFTTYMLSKDDFILLRKNVSQRVIFDMAFLGGVVGLFFSRVLYVAMHPSSAYINPLVFFVIPYFPGLSVAGFIGGLSLALYIFSLRKKLPIGKVFDIFSLALIAAVDFVFVCEGAQEALHKQFLVAGIFFACFLILFASYIVLKKISLATIWKDGSVALVTIAITSVVIGLSQAVLVLFHSIPKEAPYFIGICLFVLLLSIFRKVRKQRVSQ